MNGLRLEKEYFRKNPEHPHKAMFGLPDEISSISDIKVVIPNELLKKYKLTDHDNFRDSLEDKSHISMSEIGEENSYFIQPAVHVLNNPFLQEHKKVLDFAEECVNSVLKNPVIKTKNDLRLNINNVPLRVNVARGIAGDIISLRLLPTSVPFAEYMVMPFGWYEMMMHEKNHQGGLYLFAAVNGSGKSTTMGAIFASLLNMYGGEGVTVEDPCELPLDGRIGENGICRQTEISANKTFADASKDVARMFSATHNYLMLGEIRDPETAMSAINYSVRGIKVFATIHADTPQAVLSNLLGQISTLPGQSINLARDAVANSIRFIACQGLEVNPGGKGVWGKRRIVGDILYNPLGMTDLRVRNAIKDEKMTGVAELMSQQSHKLRIALENYQRNVSNAGQSEQVFDLNNETEKDDGFTAIDFLTEEQAQLRKAAFDKYFFDEWAKGNN